jgi:hypothetical protein
MWRRPDLWLQGAGGWLQRLSQRKGKIASAEPWQDPTVLFSDGWLQEDGHWLQFGRDGSGQSMMLA